MGHQELINRKITGLKTPPVLLIFSIDNVKHAKMAC